MHSTPAWHVSAVVNGTTAGGPTGVAATMRIRSGNANGPTGQHSALLGTEAEQALEQGGAYSSSSIAGAGAEAQQKQATVGSAVMAPSPDLRVIHLVSSLNVSPAKTEPGEFRAAQARSKEAWV